VVGLHFDYEDGSSTFLRNVSKFIPDYTAIVLFTVIAGRLISNKKFLVILHYSSSSAADAKCNQHIIDCKLVLNV
jgi:hypothetical protein